MGEQAWSWRHEPAEWARGSGGSLRVTMESGTDYWQRTHYGFRADNGPFFHTQAAGDWTLSAKVTLIPKHQYDQAGLLIHLSENCWLKTALEYESEWPAMLGAVVTNGGYSDWSTEAWNEASFSYWLRLIRRDNCYRVDWSRKGIVWQQLRLATLLEDAGQSPVAVGLYAASPKSGGGEALFEHIQIHSDSA